MAGDLVLITRVTMPLGHMATHFSFIFLVSILVLARTDVLEGFSGCLYC